MHGAAFLRQAAAPLPRPANLQRQLRRSSANLKPDFVPPAPLDDGIALCQTFCGQTIVQIMEVQTILEAKNGKLWMNVRHEKFHRVKKTPCSRLAKSAKHGQGYDRSNVASDRPFFLKTIFLDLNLIALITSRLWKVLSVGKVRRWVQMVLYTHRQERDRGPVLTLLCPATR